MPRSSKPCRDPGCGSLTKAKHGFCDDHAGQASNWQRKRPTGSTTARGYGHAWRRLRAEILARDSYLCQCEDCTAQGRVTPANEVDHIIEKVDGGTDDPSNLRAINDVCHKRKTARETARRRRA